MNMLPITPSVKKRGSLLYPIFFITAVFYIVSSVYVLVSEGKWKGLIPVKISLKGER